MTVSKAGLRRWPLLVLTFGALALLAALALTLSQATVKADHGGSGDIEFIEFVKNNTIGGDVVGLNGAKDVTISQDGKYAYVIGNDLRNSNKSGVMVFSRNATTGKLTFVEQELNPNPPYPSPVFPVGSLVTRFRGLSDVIISPNGNFVYVSTQRDQSVLTFLRDAGTGELTYLSQTHVKPPGFGGGQNVVGMAISDDGKDLYTSGAGQLSRLSVDLGTGVLTLVEGFYCFALCQAQFGGQAVEHIIKASHDVKISPDQKFLYVSSPLNHSNSPYHVAVFDRKGGTGETIQCGAGPCEFKFVQTNPDGPVGDARHDIVISPDGAFVYVGSQFTNLIFIYSRNATTGELTFLNGVTAPFSARHMHFAMSPDGGTLISYAGNSHLDSFLRDQVTGGLTLVDTERDGVNGVDGLARNGGVVISPDGKHVYTAAGNDGAVTAFFLDDGVPPVDLGCAGESVETVLNTNDSGPGSLRQALVDSDELVASPGVFPDQATICFDPSLSGETITVDSPLLVDTNVRLYGIDLASRLTISGGDLVQIFASPG